MPPSRIVLIAATLVWFASAVPVKAAMIADPSPEIKRLMAAAKEKGERELDLVWSGTSLGGSEGARKFETLFNRMYGLNAKFNFTPGPSMTDTAGRVTQEVAAGRTASTDILMGTESHYGDLVKRTVLEEYDYSRLSPRIQKKFVAPKNIGTEFYTIISGITYNTNFVPANEVPKKLEDVLNPKWKGKIASTTNAAIFDRVAMRPDWGVERMKAFITRLAAQVGGLVRASENERVISGEFIMLVMDGGGHQVRKQQLKGAPVGHVIPEDAGNISFGYMGVPRTSAHPNLAKLFINMVMSEEGQKVVFETHFADHHELPASQSAAALAELTAKKAKMLRVDIDFVMKHPEMGKLSDEFRNILRGQQGG